VPYVCENSQLDWANDDDPIPKVSDFAYVPTEEIGGSSGPAKLRIPTESEPNSSEEFENPRQARALLLALKAAGVVKVYCQYDGGNDEGFAWVEHAELVTGERLDLIALGQRLIANGVSASERMPWQKDWPDERVCKICSTFHWPRIGRRRSSVVAALAPANFQCMAPLSRISLLRRSPTIPALARSCAILRSMGSIALQGDSNISNLATANDVASEDRKLGPPVSSRGSLSAALRRSAR